MSKMTWKISLLFALGILLITREIRSENDDGKLIVDGVDVSNLNEEELYSFSEADDEKFMGELDIQAGMNAVKESKDSNGKRALPLAPIAARGAWVAGKYLFRSVLRRLKPKLSRSRKRLTKQYFKRGSYRTAKRDFNRFRPTNVKSFRGKNGQVGRTGMVGNTRITIRSKSRYGRPTMELRSGNRNFVRKFRYESRSSLRNKWG